MGVLGGHWRFLTGDLDDRVIHNVMEDHVWPQGRYPECFLLISLLEVCQEWGVLNGGTWRTLRVPDRILGWQGHSWCHWWCLLTPKKIPWKFCVDIFFRSLSRMGVLNGVTWRMLRFPDRRIGWQDHPWCHGWPCLTLRKIAWKFCVDIFIRSVSRMGGPPWEYLEDWLETWRTGSSLMTWIYFVDP